MTNEWATPEDRRLESIEYYEPKIGPLQGREELGAKSWFEQHTPGEKAKLLVRLENIIKRMSCEY